MNVLIRTDSSFNIGTGHLMRCLALAGQLSRQGAEVAFICRDVPGAMFDLLERTGYRFARLSFRQEGASQQQDAEETASAAAQLFPRGVDWLVVDNYRLGRSFETSLRRATRSIMVIDDLADREHDCDILLDQNYYQDMDQRYQGLVPPHCEMLLGPRHLLLRDEFDVARARLRQRDGKVRSILIFFGGSDPVNETHKAIQALPLLRRPDISAEVVVGGANPQRDSIEALCAGIPNVSFHCQVSNLAEMIAKADLGIGAGGSSMWERCCLGLPTITVIFAQNQKRTTEDVAATGAIHYLGWSDRLTAADYAAAIAEMIDDPKRVRRISAAALAVVGQPAAPVGQRLFEHIPHLGA